MQQLLARFSLQPLTIEDHQAMATNQAAVMVPLKETAKGYEVLFTRRSKSLRHHPGQISFPGGRQEKQDESLLQTAIRECQEEVGVTPRVILGRLPKSVTSSGFTITPYLGVFPKNAELSLCSKEVAEAFYVPLSHLLNPKHHIAISILRNQRKFQVYWIPWQQEHIWGATAGILHNLYRHLYSK